VSLEEAMETEQRCVEELWKASEIALAEKRRQQLALRLDSSSRAATDHVLRSRRPPRGEAGPLSRDVDPTNRDGEDYG
jgi:hypothetical protein